MQQTRAHARSSLRNTAILALAVFAGSCAMPMHARSSGLASGTLSDDPIWTDRPVRVDRKNQNYEPAPVEREKAFPLRIDVSPRVTVFDSASFAENGNIYVLAGAVAVSPRRICRNDKDQISACGQQARLYLKRLISNKTLECEELVRMAAVHVVSCRIAGKDLAETLVLKGAAWSATPQTTALQSESMNQKAGIWSDPRCRALGRCPP